MALAMPVVWSDRHRLHDPGGEVWVGVRTPGTELPARADAIRATLAREGARFVDAEAHDDHALLAVHDAELVEYLAGAWREWEAAGLTRDPGQDRVVPYVFAHAGLTDAPAIPVAASARAGYFAYDTMTLIGPGTWEAARAATDVALTAADLVLAGAPAAYACCRPPGHHVTRASFGGSCYLNNTAVAAARLRAALDRPVAVLDVDAHHGNGTQAIFYDDPDVLVGSVHVDPGAGWFPHFLGFAERDGRRREPQPAAGPGGGRRGMGRGRAGARAVGRVGRARWSSPSGSTPPAGIPRARSRSPTRASAPPAARWARWASPPSSSRRAATTSTRSERWCTSS